MKLYDKFLDVYATNRQKLTLVFMTYTYCSPSTLHSQKVKQVIKSYCISDTNTSLQTFTPFTDESFINDCYMLQQS